ncbi:MAG: YlbF family regulator [Planctomycetes bacterium]|nr:YlbF family regulator [Planctomycetota bacterium]
MDRLVEIAQQLGKKIAAHERTTLLKQAQKAVNDDTEAVEIIQNYQTQADKIRQLELDQKPIEVADKHLLAELEAKIGTHPKLTELTKRQVDFVEMMQKVKAAIDNQIQLDQ